jgi:hypothetical protein
MTPVIEIIYKIIKLFYGFPFKIKDFIFMQNRFTIK